MISNREEKITVMFEVLWNLDLYSEAVKFYADTGRPFWLTEAVARYYESEGKFEQSIEEWSYLIDIYFVMGETAQLMLNYQDEVFMLGSWYASTDRDRSIKYLSAYVGFAYQWRRMPGLKLPYKGRAARMLYKLRRPRSCE